MKTITIGEKTYDLVPLEESFAKGYTLQVRASTATGYTHPHLPSGWARPGPGLSKPYAKKKGD